MLAFEDVNFLKLVVDAAQVKKDNDCAGVTVEDVTINLQLFLRDKFFSTRFWRFSIRRGFATAGLILPGITTDTHRS